MTPAALRRSLLRWYDRHRRDLPWRMAPGKTVDPYAVWLSEIMLQQTTVATVIPYFTAFLGRWPKVAELAAADLDEVLHAWQGLGYYARARNLHRCAKAVAGPLGGRFPETEAELATLPGIGAYTAAAIAAIAFGKPATPVDGNVGRVMARFYAVAAPLPAAKSRLSELARALTPVRRPGDFAQALMDLGATVCTPRKPDCGRCPWMKGCAAAGQGTAEAYPVKGPRKVKPTRRGVAFWAAREDGAVLLRRRPEKGLLGGMMEIPSTDWRAAAWTAKEARAAAPTHGPWIPLPGVVRHTFTHFHLELTVLAARAQGAGDKGAGDKGADDKGADDKGADDKGVWCPVEGFADHALPTVMKKVARHAMGGLDGSGDGSGKEGERGAIYPSNRKFP